MAGVDASILLQTKLNPEQINELMVIVRTISSEVIINEDGADFWVTDTHPINGDYKGEGMPFVYRLVEPQLEPDQLKKIAETFSFQVRQEVGFSSMCSGKVNHHILAALILWFAERFTGLVDFNGALLPPEVYWGSNYCDSSWNEVEDRVQRWMVGMPGKIVSAPYETVNGKAWACHISDREFLRAWLQHPNFYMIR